QPRRRPTPVAVVSPQAEPSRPLGPRGGGGPMRRLAALVVIAPFMLGLIASPGAWAQTTKTETKSSSKSDAKASEKTEKKAKVDLNSASADDLKTPGLTADQAKKTIDGRPWKRKDELVKKNILTKAEYEKVKNGIVAHQPKDASKDTAKGAK